MYVCMAKGARIAEGSRKLPRGEERGRVADREGEDRDCDAEVILGEV